MTINDVQHRQDITPITYALDLLVILQDARITGAPVASTEVASAPDTNLNDAVVLFQTGADLSGISIGNRIGFITADGTTIEKINGACYRF